MSIVARFKQQGERPKTFKSVTQILSLGSSFHSMESINTIIRDPRYQELLAIIKGARNGLVYGAKIRFPHALVMSLIFHGGRP